MFQVILNMFLNIGGGGEEGTGDLLILGAFIHMCNENPVI